jgi:hypothetical protein
MCCDFNGTVLNDYAGRMLLYLGDTRSRLSPESSVGGFPPPDDPVSRGGVLEDAR